MSRRQWLTAGSVGLFSQGELTLHVFFYIYNIVNILEDIPIEKGLAEELGRGGLGSASFGAEGIDLSFNKGAGGNAVAHGSVESG